MTEDKLDLPTLLAPSSKTTHFDVTFAQTHLTLAIDASPELATLFVGGTTMDRQNLDSIQHYQPLSPKISHKEEDTQAQTAKIHENEGNEPPFIGITRNI